MHIFQRPLSLMTTRHLMYLRAWIQRVQLAVQSCVTDRRRRGFFKLGEGERDANLHGRERWSSQPQRYRQDISSTSSSDVDHSGQGLVQRPHHYRARIKPRIGETA